MNDSDETNCDFFNKVTSGASTVLIVFVGFTLFLFAWLKVYTVARVIQMNMEIALICAHVCLICAGIFKLHEKTELVRLI